jgi:hypothetical protein
MEVLVLSTLLLIGLILLLVEIIFIPGTTVVGIFGFLVSGAGLVFAFLNFENRPHNAQTLKKKLCNEYLIINKHYQYKCCQISD